MFKKFPGHNDENIPSDETESSPWKCINSLEKNEKAYALSE